MSRYVLSPEAVLDLVEIEKIGRKLFGVTQADKFQARFEEMFSLLSEQPGLGRFIEQLAGRNLRFMPIESYLVAYRVASSTVEIVRVVDGRTDLGEGDFTSGRGEQGRSK